MRRDARGLSGGRPSHFDQLGEEPILAPPALETVLPPRDFLPHGFPLPPQSRELDRPQIPRSQIFAFPTVAGGKVDEPTLRRKIVEVAERELVAWHNQGRPFKETDPFGIHRINTYRASDPSLMAFTTPTATFVDAWSALFVSFCVTEASRLLGLSRNPLEPEVKHIAFTSKAYRVKETVIGRYWAFPPEVRPLQVGDIVVKNRDTSRFTYQSLAAQPTQGKTHSDIVTEVGTRTARVIGGNLSQTVQKKTYHLHPSGTVDMTPGRGRNDADRIFAVLSLAASGTTWPDDRGSPARRI